MSIQNISVIGLGAMGGGLAALMLKAGYPVTGFDIVKKKITQLKPLGLKPAGSPKEAAEGADVILLSLQTWDIVTDVLDGANGILSAANPARIIVDTSTVPPDLSNSRS